MRDEENRDRGFPDLPPARGAQPFWWMELTPEQREIHYNRVRPCEHKYVYPGIDGHLEDERLRPAYSFDPYFHTTHLLPHDHAKFFSGQCECQTCQLKIGFERGRWPRRMDEKLVREKLARGKT